MPSTVLAHDRGMTNTGITFADRIHAGTHGISRAEARDRRLRAAVEIGWSDLGSAITFAAVREAYADRPDRPWDFTEEGIDLEKDGGATIYVSWCSSWDTEGTARYTESYVYPEEIDECIPHTFFDDMVGEG